MAIENTYLAGKNITLGCGFDLQAKAPLDSRQTVPAFAGLQALIDGNAAYEGMIVYDEETKKTYQAQLVDGVLAFREFGINEAELKDLIASETTAAMEFKGVTATLPENPSKGDMYKVAGENISIKIDNVDAKLGDSIVYNGEQWFLIPSGDDIEDTWRPVTDVDNNSTLTFVAGDKLEKTVAADGTITYKHVVIDAPEDITDAEAGDLNTRTYITAVETDGFGHITGYKTATENVEDTNTEYTFEGQSDEATSVYFQVTSNEEGASADVIYLDAYSKNEVDTKFIEYTNGPISSLYEDYNNLSNKLNSLTNDDDSTGRVDIAEQEIDALQEAVEDLGAYVGTIPTDEKYADITNVISYVNKKAEETLAAAQGGSSETAASVKQQLDNYKSENDTRIKAVEDDIDAINNADTGILKQAKDYADGLATNYDEKGAAAGVKTELEAEIAKKVDKVEGKDLVAISEIERLATLVNYDDTQVKADIAKKADAEAMTTELGKKVDKVDGKDLIATSEIERLATLKNYDDTALAGRVGTAEGKITALETASATHALKTEVETVDAKFADYNTTVAQKAIDDAQDARIKAIEDDYVVAADIADFETKENVKKVADDLAAYVESNDAAIADRYTKEEADGKFALITDAYDDTALVKRVKDIEDDYLKAADKTELEGKITANANAIELLTNGVSADEVDGVNDLINYVKTHGPEVTGMKADIAANAKAITDHEALAAETYETKDDATSKKTEIDGRLDALEGKVDVAKVSTAIADAVKVETERATGIENGLAGRIGDLEAVKDDYKTADATLKSELQAGIDADVKALAGEGNTSTVKKNADDIASLFEQFQWGEF